MPTSCIIVGCTNRQVKGAKNNKGFHRIPKVPASGDEETKVLAKQRRDAWIAAIRREGITTDANLDNKRVCSDHFRDGEYELHFYIRKARLIFQDSIQDFKYNSTKSDISLNSYIPSYATGVLNCLRCYRTKWNMHDACENDMRRLHVFVDPGQPGHGRYMSFLVLLFYSYWHYFVSALQIYGNYMHRIYWNHMRFWIILIGYLVQVVSYFFKTLEMYSWVANRRGHIYWYLHNFPTLWSLSELTLLMIFKKKCLIMIFLLLPCFF